MRNLRDSCPCSIHSLPEGRQGNGANCVEFTWLYLTQNELCETHVICGSLGSLPGPEKVPLFGVDCMKFASLADVVGGWCKICSVREQFPGPEKVPLFGVDCTKFALLADVVGEWREICSVREQFSLFVYKRLTKTTVSLKGE